MTYLTSDILRAHSPPFPNLLGPCLDLLLYPLRFLRISRDFSPHPLSRFNEKNSVVPQHSFLPELLILFLCPCYTPMNPTSTLPTCNLNHPLPELYPTLLFFTMHFQPSSDVNDPRKGSLNPSPRILQKVRLDHSSGFVDSKISLFLEDLMKSSRRSRKNSGGVSSG